MYERMSGTLSFEFCEVRGEKSNMVSPTHAVLLLDLSTFICQYFSQRYVKVKKKTLAHVGDTMSLCLPLENSQNPKVSAGKKSTTHPLIQITLWR